MPAWAACLLTGQASELAALRLFPNIDFAEIGGVYWLRGPGLDDALELELKKIPGLARFELSGTDRLRPVESRIPDRSLPPGTWRPLKQAVTASLPVAALGGQNSQKLSIALVRSSEEAQAIALSCHLEHWVEYATKAGLARLNGLSFAAAEHGEVLVLGFPLPAIGGRHYSGAQGILVPCGFTWIPGVEPSVLAHLFGLNSGDVVALAEDNTHQIIRREQFVPASRSAARTTLKQSIHG